MRPLPVLAIIWPLALAYSGAAAAAPLALGEQALLEEQLGEGVVGQPVAGRALTPKFEPLRDGTWTYRIVSGEAKGETEQHVVKRLEHHPWGAGWRYTVDNKERLFAKQLDDGSLMFVTEEDPDQGVISRYRPAQPGLLMGLAPGESRSSSIGVEVSDLGSPEVVSHKGTLEVTYSYLGAYKVTTPAGAYDAALIRWTYKGKVGPATVDDTQYRFFAENVGMVASVEKLDVSALLVYQSHKKVGKLLARTPE
jgi:hypothetical protein